MYGGPALGLFTSPNPFSQTPPGTLRRADNVRFTAPGVISPRRGFDVLNNNEAAVGTSSSRFDSIAFYKAAEGAASGILAAYDLTKVSLYTAGLGFTDFSGTFLPVGVNRMRFEGAARSAFFNTSQGLKVWDGVGNAAQPVNAGNPRGLWTDVVNRSGSGWQLPNTAVAYRHTLCSKDAFGRVIEGAPSGRVILRNYITIEPGYLIHLGGGSTSVNATANGALSPHNLQVGDVITLTPGEAFFAAASYTVTSVPDAFSFYYSDGVAQASSKYNTLKQTFSITRSASLTVHLPTDASALNFVRVYRSEMTATATDTPSDELYQVYESAYLTASDLAAGLITFSDTAPESTLDVPLYTNENTGDGALAANYQAPVCLDVVYWAGRMWGSNVAYKHSLTFSILGTGAPNGIQAGTDFQVLGPTPSQFVVFSGITQGTTPVGDEFQVFTNGDPGFNVQRTALDLVRAINTSLNNSPAVDAYYISDEGGIPGTILLVARAFGNRQFSLYSSNTPQGYAPQLPPAGGWVFPAPFSTDNAHPAGLVYSRLGKPEAFPPTNHLAVNSDNDRIIRIFPLHYRLLIFKTDGIYTCTNVEPFHVQKLSAYVLLAPDSLCVLEDRVYALTDQGSITISDAGVVDISTPIYDSFRALDTPTAITIAAARSFALAYRSEQQVLLWTPRTNDDGTFGTDNAQALVYSTLAQGFTRYLFGARAAAISPDTNSMVIAPTDGNALWVENKTLTDSDYYDFTGIIGQLITSIAGSVVTLSDASGIVAGDLLVNSAAGSQTWYLVTNVTGNVVTVNGAPSWTTSVFLVSRKGFRCTVEFNKFTGGRPAELSMFGQVSLLFRSNTVHDLELDFATENATNPAPVFLAAVGWGESKCGDAPWGDPGAQLRRVETLPIEAANACQLSVAFTTRQAGASFELLGIDVQQRADSGVNKG